MFVFVCFLIGELFFATVFLSSFSLNYLMQVFWPVLNTQQTKKKQVYSHKQLTALSSLSLKLYI